MTAPKTPMQIAKAWFRSHPSVQVTFHWRQDVMAPAARERMTGPRTVIVKGKNVVFQSSQHGQSEISLVGMDVAVTADGELQLYDAGTGRHLLTYAGAS